jgi:type VI secretion system protein VasG
MTVAAQSDIEDLRKIVSHLTPSCREVLSKAADLAYRQSHVALDIAHFISIVLDSPALAVTQRLVQCGLPVEQATWQTSLHLSMLATGEGLPPALSEDLIELLRAAWVAVSLQNANEGVDCEDVLRALLTKETLMQSTIKSIPAMAELLPALVDVQGEHNRSMAGYESTLSSYTINLTQQAQQGDLDPVIGREAEIDQVIEILLRRRQNNPILVGEAGVGKTAVVEGLANRIAARSVPQELCDVQLLSLDIGKLRAGAGARGEMESRLKSLIAAVAASPSLVILFIDEAHSMVSGPNNDQGDIANLIKPELARGTLRTIGATTWAEYKLYFEKDPALSRRFQLVRVNEPTLSQAQDILQGLLPALQKHHAVRISPSAVSASVFMSTRYIQGRQLPDKAISLLDTACARVRASDSRSHSKLMGVRQHELLLEQRLMAMEEASDGLQAMDKRRDALALESARLERFELEQAAQLSAANKADGQTASRSEADQVVRAADVAQVVSDWIGVPTHKLLLDTHSAVQRLEEMLALRVIAQKHATSRICARLRNYSAGLEDPQRPIGVFLLAGPSGVGKTETAHAVAEAFFGRNAISVINMSEYQESHSVSKLKGAPAGYVGFGKGGVLTEAIRRRPYGVLLLDEIEKAHPDVLELFLQVFDKGVLEDAEGVAVDFRNILIIMTSNSGSQLLESQAPTLQAQELFALQERLVSELLDEFTPAFIGRSEVVPYFPLGAEELRQIVTIKLASLSQRFSESYGAELSFSPDTLSTITDRCSSQSLGARWAEQIITERVVSPLASEVLDRLARGKRIADVELALSTGEVALRWLDSGGQDVE